MKALPIASSCASCSSVRPKSFGTVARATISSDRFVECKNTRCFCGSLFRVLETLFVIAGLNVVMGQLLNRTRKLFAVTLESFSHVTMQATAANRIEFFVENFANLVVSETERVVRIRQRSVVHLTASSSASSSASSFCSAAADSSSKVKTLPRMALTRSTSLQF